MTGTVYSGINNIYRVRNETDGFHECRIKGKILNDDDRAYNPLAPGDRVEFTSIDVGKGMILRRLNRRNKFSRWNQKREAWQIIAANLDILVVVMSAGNPPFRPRFVDRVLITAAQNNVPSAVVVNKNDLGIQPWIEMRMAAWRAIGIDTFYCSAATGEGIDVLKNSFSRSTIVLFGPSGVGKSTLINCLAPEQNLPTAEISRKNNRGRHVTNFGQIIDTPWGGQLVDTPGIREILVREIEPGELPHLFPEFATLEKDCVFHPCSHRHEPGCAVLAGMEGGNIHSDRYANYVKIRNELEKLH